ncbi:hypothetical protein EDD27_7565 [Nonomuraea polychroma]|uniref:Uncharacterized protein n=1 Tax=Nonomuraea polychroma TaxID=46176 RepID=A0A438MH66_9ACTN|nr:hypothetical protein EDD27_7565 [Nonomuraea polychroma]
MRILTAVQLATNRLSLPCYPGVCFLYGPKAGVFTEKVR